jgi:NADPH-dependent F420 reductase
MKGAEPRRVAVLGASGALGYGLAVRLASAGVAVTIGSRSHERAEETVARARQDVPDAAIDGATNPEAAARGDLVILAVPFANHAETLRSICDALRPGTVVVDTTVPLASAVGGRPTRLLGVWQGSAAEQAAELVPERVTVVAALHTVAAALLADAHHELDQDVLLYADRAADKASVAAVLERIPGLRCVDCGRLEHARVTEALTAVMIGINRRYKTHAGVRITGLADRVVHPGAAVGARA